MIGLTLEEMQYSLMKNLLLLWLSFAFFLGCSDKGDGVNVSKYVNSSEVKSSSTQSTVNFARQAQMKSFGPKNTSTKKVYPAWTNSVEQWSMMSDEDKALVIAHVESLQLLPPSLSSMFVDQYLIKLNRVLPYDETYRTTLLKAHYLLELMDQRKTADLTASLLFEADKSASLGNQGICVDWIKVSLLKYAHLDDMRYLLETMKSHIRGACKLVEVASPVEQLYVETLFNYHHTLYPFLDQWIERQLGTLFKMQDDDLRLDLLMFITTDALPKIKRRLPNQQFESRIMENWNKVLELAEYPLIEQRLLTHEKLWDFIAEIENWHDKLIHTDIFAIDIELGHLGKRAPRLKKELNKLVKKKDYKLISQYINACQYDEFLYRVQHEWAVIDPLVVEDIARWLSTCDPLRESLQCSCNPQKLKSCLSKIGPSGMTLTGFRREAIPRDRFIFAGALVETVQRVGDGRDVSATLLLEAGLDLADLIPGAGGAVRGIKAAGKVVAKKAASTLAKRSSRLAAKKAAKQTMKQHLKGAVTQGATKLRNKTSSLAQKARQRYKNKFGSKTSKLKEFLNQTTKNIDGIKVYIQGQVDNTYNALRAIRHEIRHADEVINVSKLVKHIAEKTSLGTKMSKVARKAISFSVSKLGLDAHVKTDVVLKWCTQKALQKADDKFKDKIFDSIRSIFPSGREPDRDPKEVITGENLVLTAHLAYKLITL
jgi:hypothetical protein